MVNPIQVSLGGWVGIASIDGTSLKVEAEATSADITAEFHSLRPVVNRLVIHQALIAARRANRWWNLQFDLSAIEAALNSDRYRITGLPSSLTISSMADLARVQRLAGMIVRRLIEGYYRKSEDDKSQYVLGGPEAGTPAFYYKEKIV